MNEKGILPGVAIERINRGVVTGLEMLAKDRLLIVSSGGTFVFECDINKMGETALFVSECERPSYGKD